MTLHTPKCFNSHIGAWACEPKALEKRLHLIKSGMVKAVEVPAVPTDSEIKESIPLIGGGRVAVIDVDDVMMRQRSKYGGVSTIEIRRKVRAVESAMKAGSGVEAILLAIDSPGGQISGQEELMEDLARAKAAGVKIYAHVSGMAASAAYWLASAAEMIWASPMSLVGSIGVFAVLEDTTGAMEMEGVKLHVVRSVPLKGLGEDGKITQELVDKEQEIINGFHAFFEKAIVESRGDTAKAAFTGEVFFAEEALQLGLIDAIATHNEVEDLILNHLKWITAEDGAPVLEMPALASTEDSEDALIEVEKLRECVDDLRDEIGDLNDTIARMEEEAGEQAGREEALTESIQDLEEEVASLKKEIEEQGEEIEDRKRAIEIYEKTCASMLDDIKGMIEAAGLHKDLPRSEAVQQMKALLAYGRPVVQKQAREQAKIDVGSPDAVLVEYQRKYGGIEGGRRFRIEHPALAGKMHL